MDRAKHYAVDILSCGTAVQKITFGKACNRWMALKVTESRPKMWNGVVNANANAKAHRPTLRLDLTIPAARHVAEWHGVHTVLPATHTFIHEWNKPSCMHFVSIHKMVSPSKVAHIWISLLLSTHPSIPKGWKAESAWLADLIADSLPT